MLQLVTASAPCHCLYHGAQAPQTTVAQHTAAVFPVVNTPQAELAGKKAETCLRGHLGLGDDLLLDVGGHHLVPLQAHAAGKKAGTQQDRSAQDMRCFVTSGTHTVAHNKACTASLHVVARASIAQLSKIHCTRDAAMDA